MEEFRWGVHFEYLGLRNPRSGKVSSSTCGSALTWKWKLSEGGLHICYRPRVYAYFLWLSRQGKENGELKAIQSFPILKRHPCKNFGYCFQVKRITNDLTNKTLHSVWHTRGHSKTPVFHAFALHLELERLLGNSFIPLWRLIHCQKWGPHTQ